MSIFQSKEKDGTISVAVIGKVSNPPELKEKKNGIIDVKFGVRYGKGKFMNCSANSDYTVGAVANMLEKDDEVAVAGIYRTWEYDGKTYGELTVDGIFPLTVPNIAAAINKPDDGSSFKEVSSEDEDDDGELPF